METTSATEPADEGDDNWLLMTDPRWTPAGEDDLPPIEMVVGVWPFDQDGEPGPFRPNPRYRPEDDDSPSDPVDALVRDVVAGHVEPEQVQMLLRDCLFDAAMDGEGRLLIVGSDGDRGRAVIATAEVHRLRVAAPGWTRVDLMDLVGLLPDDVDVLINPAGKSELCLTGEEVRAALLLTEDEADEAFAQLFGDDTAVDSTEPEPAHGG